MRAGVTKGDYVLATKWGDGDPKDHFAVGFYVEERWPGRHIVVDNDGVQFRANGFRRVEKISRERGKFIVDNIKAVELSDRSLWWWKRAKMTIGVE